MWVLLYLCFFPVMAPRLLPVLSFFGIEMFPKTCTDFFSDIVKRAMELKKDDSVENKVGRYTIIFKKKEIGHLMTSARGQTAWKIVDDPVSCVW